MFATEEQRVIKLPVNVRREASLDRFLSRRKKNKYHLDSSGDFS